MSYSRNIKVGIYIKDNTQITKKDDAGMNAEKEKRICQFPGNESCGNLAIETTGRRYARRFILCISARVYV